MLSEGERGSNRWHVLTLSTLTDRLGRRRLVLLALLLIAFTGTVLLPVFHNEFVWVLAVMIGFTRDAVMTLFISPPVGNRLAEINPSFAFIFWAAMAVVGAAVLLFIREPPRGRRPAS